MKRFILAGIAVLLVGIWTIAEAEPGHGKHRMKGPGAMFKELGLTDQQKSKIREVRMAAKKEMVRLRADAKIARIELEESMHQPNPKPTEVKAKVAAINNVRGKLLEKRVDLRLEMKKILTPEQQEKAREFRMKRRMHHKKMRPGGMRGDERQGWRRGPH